MPPQAPPRIKLVGFQEYQTGIMAVRKSVFVEELGIAPQLEWDDRDSRACYAVALVAEKIVGVGRMQQDGEIGRVAILPAFRHQGIGSRIVRRLVEAATQSRQEGVYLSSQLDAVAFYAKRGFMPTGDTYIAAGIAHQRMYLSLSGKAAQ